MRDVTHLRLVVLRSQFWTVLLPEVGRRELGRRDQVQISRMIAIAQRWQQWIIELVIVRRIVRPARDGTWTGKSVFLESIKQLSENRLIPLVCIYLWPNGLAVASTVVKLDGMFEIWLCQNSLEIIDGYETTWIVYLCCSVEHVSSDGMPLKFWQTFDFDDQTDCRSKQSSNDPVEVFSHNLNRYSSSCCLNL